MLAVYKNIDNLYRERIERGISQQALAKVADVSLKAINKYERGILYPTQKVYNRLAMIFGWEMWI